MDNAEAHRHLQKAYHTDGLRFIDLPSTLGGSRCRQIVHPTRDDISGTGVHKNYVIAGGLAAQAYFQAVEMSK